jgi:4-amino-4-deoxy-L-arabinose transferase-like glycosyltransferase
MKKPILILVGIVLLAAFLRLWRIGDVPPGVNRDEASIGFTAHSLRETGKDEYGRVWPISFESFGDWKLPLYIYTAVPFVAAFGPTELAIRLPSALAGTVTVLLVYFLVMELLERVSVSQRINVSLLASFFLAVSPWHLHLSRVESESNVAVLFVTAALLLFFKSLRKTGASWWLPASTVLFALTYYTYHGNHISTTLIIAGLVFFFRKQLPKGKTLIVSALLFLLLTGFILVKTFAQADATKIAGISIFGDPAVIHSQIELPRSQSGDPNSPLTRLRYNRVTYAAITVTTNYLRSFSPEFLFFKGGGNRAHNIQGIGNFYLIDGLLLILGLIALITKRKTPAYAFMLWWLLISPVAAAITKDAPHTNRMFALFPLPAIIMALGATQISRKLVYVLGIGYLALVIGYLNLYHNEFPKNESDAWGYAYRQLAPRLTQKYADKKVIMSHPERSPYIFLILYMNYDPEAYQREAIRYPPTPDAFVHVAGFGRFAFRNIDWEKDLTEGTIVVEYTAAIPEAYLPRIQETIYAQDGTPVFSIL